LSQSLTGAVSQQEELKTTNDRLDSRRQPAESGVLPAGRRPRINEQPRGEGFTQPRSR
jgi:hypothetical protein